MRVYEDLINKKENLAVIGLGYGNAACGEPKRGINVIGFDINKQKIEKYKQGIDITNEVGMKNQKTTVSSLAMKIR